ncbi:hypothetical protein FOZ60_010130 [Perkinsus olseni]|uniref:Prolyl 4-hydroxylase alpha subunit domain-containing protein n=1 Tax=Perkinsus olseni TaxID=32597 RepID=A0A7J6PCL4_PEROL|nr:hypothetical protein FOZ60_010130 [Perkinsus olseni]
MLPFSPQPSGLSPLPQPGYGRPPLYPMSPMQNQPSPQPQRGVSAPVGVAGGCTPQRQQSALHQSCPLGPIGPPQAFFSPQHARAPSLVGPLPSRGMPPISPMPFMASPLPGPQTARQMVGREEERAEEKNIFEARLKRDLDGAKDSPAVDENSRADGNDDEKVTRLSAYVICRSPKVRLVPDFLTAEECSYMISLAEGSGGLDDIVAEIERRVASLHHDGAFRPWTVFVTLNDISRDAGGETLFPALGLKIRPKAGTALVWPNCLENGEADERVVHEALAPRGVRKYAINCFVNEKPVAELMRGRSSSGDESDPNNLWLEYDD